MPLFSNKPSAPAASELRRERRALLLLREERLRELGGLTLEMYRRDQFNESLVGVLELLATDRVALMCAEAVPWRCHRSLIADALFVRGHVACEISSATRLQPHRLTSFARVEGDTITYP